MKKEVFSARSGRRLAKIELLDAVNFVRIGERYSFRILQGFGNMWRKSFDLQDMTVKKDGDELLLRIVAFPAERDGVGILDIEMLLPPRLEVEQSTSAGIKKRSFMKIVRGYLQRPR